MLSESRQLSDIASDGGERMLWEKAESYLWIKGEVNDCVIRKNIKVMREQKGSWRQTHSGREKIKGVIHGQGEYNFYRLIL